MPTLFIIVNMTTTSHEYHWMIQEAITKRILDEGYAMSPESAFVDAKQTYDAYILQHND